MWKWSRLFWISFYFIEQINWLRWNYTYLEVWCPVWNIENQKEGQVSPDTPNLQFPVWYPTRFVGISSDENCRSEEKVQRFPTYKDNGLTGEKLQEQSRGRIQARSEERSFHQKISGSWQWCWPANTGGRKGGWLPPRVFQGRLPWEQGTWSKTGRPWELGNVKIFSVKLAEVFKSLPVGR